MIRSQRNRKQPDSIYRLQEEEYNVKSNKRVHGGLRAANMNLREVADTMYNHEQHHIGSQKFDSHDEIDLMMRPCKVARISEDTSSESTDHGRSKPSKRVKTKRLNRNNGESTQARGTFKEKKTWENTGHTKLGFMAQKFANILQTRAKGTIYFLEAKELLDVNARRLYDILHVLDGAGLITIDRSCKADASITWNGGSSSPMQKLRMLHNQKLEDELNQLNEWIHELKHPRYQSNTTSPWRSIEKKLLDTTKLYVTKDELWKQHQGGVDLILAPQPGTVLYIPSTPVTPCANTPSAPSHDSSYSLQLMSPPSARSSEATAFLLEDNGVLKSLELGAPPPPLLASCCSDFSLVHLASPILTPSTSDWGFHQRVAATTAL